MTMQCKDPVQHESQENVKQLACGAYLINAKPIAPLTQLLLICPLVRKQIFDNRDNSRSTITFAIYSPNSSAIKNQRYCYRSI